MDFKISSLRRANELKGAYFKYLGSETILKLAQDHRCPHYIVTNPVTKENEYVFLETELNEWFSRECIKKVDGIYIAKLQFIDFVAIQPKSKIPKELMAINDLCELPKEIIDTPPGIYFLCLNGIIQYIGQAVHVCSRVSAHLTIREKRFDSIFFIPCPKSELNNLEGALIRKYKPPLNGSAPVGIGNREKEKEYINQYLNQDILSESLTLY